MDNNGCQTTINATVLFESTSGIVDNQNTELIIYPNPTVNNATIEWFNNDIDELTITDSNGKILNSENVTNQQSYQTENLSSGIYFVTLRHLNETIALRKLIVL